MALRPAKWILWSPLIALPTLGAWYFDSTHMERQLADKVRQQLNANFKDTNALVVRVTGRDVRLEGAAPDESVVSGAKQAAASVYGVRRVTDSKVVLGPLVPPLVPPVIAPLVPGSKDVVIKGTWGHVPSETLTVILGDKKYTYGINPELGLDGANGWVLKPGSLNAGTYSLNARVSRGTETVEAVAPGSITIVDSVPAASTPAPIPATIGSFYLENDVPAISGTWDSENATALRVQAAGKTWDLSKDGPLRAPSPGQWTLVSRDLVDGTHKVIVIQTRKGGGADKATSEGLVVVDTQAPAVPQIIQGMGFPIKGTFDAADTERLTVSVGDKAYTAGSGSPLATRGNDWSLALDLPPGTYSIVAMAADRAGNISAASPSVKITMAEPEPPAALVAPAVSALTAAADGPQIVTGTWAPDVATGLTVDVNGQHFELGQNKALTTNGQNWSLTLPLPLPAGSWDVVVTATDAQGRTVKDETMAEVTIRAPVPVQIPAAAPDCTAGIAGLLSKSPIGFSTDSASLSASDLETVQHVAGLTGHCAGVALEIGGHTDSIAPARYNESLSQRRADAVMKALIANGIEAKVLSAKGYGESRPVATNDTPEGRMLNRRIEIKTFSSTGQ